MKIRPQRKCLLNKNSPCYINQSLKKSLFNQRLSQKSNFRSSQLSFDSFFYRDHVTLKRYPYQNLKKHHATKRQSEIQYRNENWRKQQQIQMLNFIQYIDLWKSLKQNRNNILVYGNKKYGKQHLFNQTQPDSCKQLQMGQGKTFQVFKKIVENQQTLPFQGTNHNNLSVNCQDIKKKSSLSPDLESIGKLKKKVNIQLYQMNKQLLRDYLKDKKQYNVNFNQLIKNQDCLQSKLHKIRTLIKVFQGKGGKQNTFQQSPNKTEFIQNLLPQDVQKREIRKQKRYSIQKKLRLKNEFPDCSPRKNQSFHNLCLKGIKDNYIQQKTLLKKDKNLFTLKKIGKKSVLRTQADQQKIDKAFDKQWQKMDQQIQIKYRRQADFSLNQLKRKKSPNYF